MSETSNNVQTPAQPSYTHIIASPYIPKSALDQRYFRGLSKAGLGIYHSRLLANNSSTQSKVLRFAHEDFGKIELSVSSDNSISDFRLDLYPDELRALAGRLLDAAHDIETNPAVHLSPASQHLEHIEKAA